MDQILIMIIQWAITIMIIGGIAWYLYEVLKNTAAGKAANAIFSPFFLAAGAIADGFEECEEKFFSLKCLGFLAWFLPSALAVAFIFSKTFRSRVQRWVRKLRGRDVTQEEAQDAGRRVEDAIEKYYEDNPEMEGKLGEKGRELLERKMYINKASKDIGKMIDENKQATQGEKQQQQAQLDQETAEDNAEVEAQADDAGVDKDDLNDAADGAGENMGSDSFFPEE